MFSLVTLTKERCSRHSVGKEFSLGLLEYDNVITTNQNVTSLMSAGDTGETDYSHCTVRLSIYTTKWLAD